jgi:hypothetical protein
LAIVKLKLLLINWVNGGLWMVDGLH